MWDSLLSNPAKLAILAGLAGVLLIALVALVISAWRRARVTPDERERRRRELLSARGKMGDATLVEIRDDLLFYSYGVRGVEYTASQDVTLLHQFLPPDFSSAGSVSVKYDPRNPANSIVLAEHWSGLRSRKAG